MPIPDIFASTLNHQLPKSFSWVQDAKAMAVDPFSVSWNKRSPLHVPSLQCDSNVFRNIPEHGNCSFNNTSMAIKTVASRVTKSPVSSFATQSTNIVTAMVSNNTTGGGLLM